jgi:hypothetical protein
MVRRRIVAFVKTIVGNGSRVNHTSIIAKHARGTIEEYAHQTESISEINDSLSGLKSNHEFQSLGSCFYTLQLLAKGTNKCLFDKLNDARHCSASDKVMVEISILVGSSTYRLTSRYRLVRRKFLSYITINRRAPVILNRSSHIILVRDNKQEPCRTRPIATKVAIRVFKSIEIALTKRTTITE